MLSFIFGQIDFFFLILYYSFVSHDNFNNFRSFLSNLYGEYTYVYIYSISVIYYIKPVEYII